MDPAPAILPSVSPPVPTASWAARPETEGEKTRAWFTDASAQFAGTTWKRQLQPHSPLRDIPEGPWRRETVPVRGCSLFLEGEVA